MGDYWNYFLQFFLGYDFYTYSFHHFWNLTRPLLLLSHQDHASESSNHWLRTYTSHFITFMWITFPPKREHYVWKLQSNWTCLTLTSYSPYKNPPDIEQSVVYPFTWLFLSELSFYVLIPSFFFRTSDQPHQCLLLSYQGLLWKQGSFVISHWAILKSTLFPRQSEASA